jgi:pyrroline-5-carboxylate reductase
MTPPLAVGFLGAGQMATALAKGWLAAGLLDPARSLASDPAPAARERFTAGTGVRSAESNADVLAAADLLILAVKPQAMSGLLAEITPRVERRHLLVSIAAGVTLDQLAAGLGADARLVRVMPNTPCLVGASASGFAPGPTATAEDVAVVERLFAAVGTAVRVPEPLLDAVTGLSGSGPAFVYVMIEALADGGVRAGLPRDTAQKLAAQTVLGAAKMVLETGQHPGALKDAVASPGGTTIAGLHALERAGVRAALIDAVTAAASRATELGKK